MRNIQLNIDYFKNQKSKLNCKYFKTLIDLKRHKW